MNLRGEGIHVFEGFGEFGNGGANTSVEVDGFAADLHIGSANERSTSQDVLYPIKVCMVYTHSSE